MRHSGFWMLQPGHGKDFNRPDYMPMVENVVSISAVRQPPAFDGDTAVIYRGVWYGRNGQWERIVAETPDGYDTASNAMRMAAFFYHEITRNGRKILPPHRDNQGNVIVLLTDEERAEARRILESLECHVHTDLDMIDGTETPTHVIRTFNDPSVGIYGQTIGPCFDTVDGVLNFVLDHEVVVWASTDPDLN